MPTTLLYYNYAIKVIYRKIVADRSVFNYGIIQCCCYAVCRNNVK
jgi:hypothetical protein